MCATNGKIKIEVYLTPEELILLAKLLKGKKDGGDIQAFDGETNPKDPPK